MIRDLKKKLCLLLAAAVATTGMLGAATTGSFAAAGYTDVPEDSWAVSVISQAKTCGLMQGKTTTEFGYGQQVTKAEFAKMLCNMLKWTTVQNSTQSFTDVTPDLWYYGCVETAVANEAIDAGGTFLPDSPITREEMAVMFVRGLGLADAAKAANSFSLNFTDVTADKGYIAVAKDIGMVDGTSATTFSPAATAKREEAAAMLVRVYENYYGDTQFMHGFYAISSYSQKDLTKDMDAVTLGWSSMNYDSSKGAWLNTGSENSNQFKIPDGYESIINYMDGNGTKMHLGVYMDTSLDVNSMLQTEDGVNQAVAAIMAELGRTYDAVGKNPYSGVTIDFEGLKGTVVKNGFSSFVSKLDAELAKSGKTLYVTVQPVLQDGVYYDGFDYRAIGQYADKVILMAHDYNPTSLTGYTGTEYYKNAALTPIGQVYYALHAVMDENTGVQDAGKVVLAVSMKSVGWLTDESGKLVQEKPVYGSTEAVHNYMTKAETVKGFSQTYRNPYMTYTSDAGNHVFLWYEDAQSLGEKAALARMMGIDGISIWRLGEIPAYSDYSVMSSLK